MLRHEFDFQILRVCLEFSRDLQLLLAQAQRLAPTYQFSLLRLGLPKLLSSQSQSKLG